MNEDTPAVKTLLRMRDICERTGFSRSTIYRMINEGEFPKPKPITPFCRGWYVPDFNDWVAKVSKEKPESTPKP